MLTILVRVNILTDALASVASVWIRAWFSSSTTGLGFHCEGWLTTVSTVKAVLPVEDDDSYPTLPWLDITQTNCNCNKYPTCGLIVQNNSNESQFLYDDGDHSDDSEIMNITVVSC
jgi:hypothetical protein